MTEVIAQAVNKTNVTKSSEVGIMVMKSKINRSEITMVKLTQNHDKAVANEAEWACQLEVIFDDARIVGLLIKTMKVQAALSSLRAAEYFPTLAERLGQTRDELAQLVQSAFVANESAERDASLKIVTNTLESLLAELEVPESIELPLHINSESLG